MTLPNRIVVSRALGVRAHSRTKGKVFAVDYGTKEFPFYILSLKGKVGRPKLEDIKGQGLWRQDKGSDSIGQYGSRSYRHPRESRGSKYSLSRAC